MRIFSFILLPASLVLGGCTSLACGLVKPGGGPSLELAFFSDGDAPTVTILRFYSGAYRVRDAGVVEIEPLGQRRRCRKVVGPEVRELKAILASPEFERVFAAELEKGHDTGLHDAVLSVERRGDLVQRQPEVMSPELLELLEPFEDLSRATFPSWTEIFLPFSLDEVKPRTPTSTPATGPPSGTGGARGGDGAV